MSLEDVSAGKTEAPDEPVQAESKWFERILTMFIRGGDSEREKKRLLRQIVRDLKRFKGKYYRARGEMALPGLGKFFYDIYRFVGPAQVLVQHADSSGLLKTIIIESVLTDELRLLRDQLSEESIRERVQNTNPKDLMSEIKDQLVTYFSAFDADRVKEISAVYYMLTTFLDLVHFDYYFLLKKFDPVLPERDFTYTARLEPISGGYIMDDLKEFLEILYSIDRNSDWERLFDRFKEYRGIDVVSRPAWKKVLHSLKDMQRSGLLELIIRHVEKDPHYKVAVRPTRERIVEPYLSKMKTQTELIVQKIFQERRNSRIDVLLVTLFGSTNIERMKNYTEKSNATFSRKMLGGFTHTAPLNYLKAFLLDFFKKDIREVVDLLIIRGKWTTNIMSQQLSEAFHHLMQTSEELMKFDDSLADDGEVGSKLRRYLARADKDQNSMKAVRQILKDVNTRAQTMISESAQDLIAIGKNLKQVIEDQQRQPHELIVNWKEIELASEEPVRDRMLDIYKKIFAFIQLMQVYMKGE